MALLYIPVKTGTFWTRLSSYSQEPEKNLGDVEALWGKYGNNLEICRYIYKNGSARGVGVGALLRREGLFPVPVRVYAGAVALKNAPIWRLQPLPGQSQSGS